MAEQEERRPSRRREDEEREAAQPQAESPRPGATPTGPLTADEAREVVRLSHEAAMEAVRAASAPMGLGPLGVAEASPADIVDEQAKAGPAFGAFVKAVGLAVAEAQQKLDETLVTTAKALSDTKIKVIAVFEQEIDNDGKMTAGKAHLEELPLVNYLMPTAYHWTRVYLEADMKVKEYNATNGFNIQGRSSSFTAGASARYGLTGFSASGSARYSTGSYQYGGETSVAQDEAVGSLHMEATLEPRADIQLPRPFVLQKGPRLKVTAGAREDILNSANPPEVIGRKMTLTAELRDNANNPLPNKQLEVRIGQPLLNYSMNPANGKTDNNGQLSIEIRREGAAFDRTRPPEAVSVNLWLGLVNEQVVINI